MDNNNKLIAQLVNEIQNDNQKAFTQLYNLTSERAYFVALRFVKSETDAQDILQESYIKALTKIKELDKPESFQSWFNQIVANKSKDFLKKKNPMLFEAEEHEVFEVIPDDNLDFSPEENLDKNELQQTVMEVLDELSEEKRACVVMMYYNEMSVSQIAESLEIPEGTVKTRLFSARKDLKDKFEKRGITSAFSVAPFGVVLWAMRRASGVAYASFVASGAAATTAAAVGAGAASVSVAAGTVTSGGLGAKFAAMSLTKKVIASVTAAAVMTGATVGTIMVINSKEETPPAITEEIQWTVATADMLVIEGNEIVNFTEKLAGNIEIPETINGKEINVITEGAFANCDALTAVKLPATLKELWIHAFFSCKNLKEVCFTSANCGYGTLIHGYGPFEGCDSLEKFVFSNNVKRIPTNICKNLPSLKTVVFEGTVTEIGEDAFYNCKNLETIDLSNVEKIEKGAFASSGLKRVDFSDKLTEIALNAFANCEALTAVKLPESLTTLHEHAFFSCNNLKEVYFTSAKCGYSTLIYGYGPFEGCDSLEKFVFSNNVKRIPTNICKNLPNLKTVVFEGTVTEIQTNAFNGCTSLESVKFGGTKAQWDAVKINAGNNALTSETVKFTFNQN